MTGGLPEFRCSLFDPPAEAFRELSWLIPLLICCPVSLAFSLLISRWLVPALLEAPPVSPWLIDLLVVWPLVMISLAPLKLPWPNSSLIEALLSSIESWAPPWLVASLLPLLMDNRL